MKFKAGVKKYSDSELPVIYEDFLIKEKQITTIDSGDSKWNIWFEDIKDANSLGDKNLKKITVSFKNLESASLETTCFCEFEFKNWNRDKYLLFPGAVYNGNRFRSLPLDYPPLITDPDMMGANFPTTITDVHRLSDTDDASKIELFSGDMSFPCMGIYDPLSNKAIFITTGQKTPAGDILFTFNENLHEGRALLNLSSPGVRGEFRYSMCHMDREKSDDSAYTFYPEEMLKITFSYYEYPCDSITEFFRIQMKIGLSYMDRVPSYCTVPFSHGWELIESWWNSGRWMEKEGYYWSFPGFFNNMMDYQLGWVGGVNAAFALYKEGNSTSKKRALENFKTITEKTQSSSGLLYGSGNKGEFFSDGIFGEPWPFDMTSIRKNADALYFLMKFIYLESNSGMPVDILEEVEIKTKNLADAMCQIWSQNNQFGQIVDIKDTAIKIGGSGAGGLIPAGLALAAKYFKSDYYMTIAQESAKYYYEDFTKKGITTSGPIEILQCPDSESAFALLETFIILYETSGDDMFLTMAEDAAAQFSSWCILYDFIFPENSEFGKHGIKTTGAVVANVQNKHGAPGICTMSGDSLFKLFRATGKTQYIELLQSISHGIVQYISRNDRPITAWDGREMPSGWICERVNMSDWEGRENIGGVFYCPCWCEVSMMLTYAEIPGIYLQSDINRLFVFDHVECSIIKVNDKDTEIKIYNPTKYDAKVKLFIEETKDCVNPLDFDWISGCKVVEIKSLESKNIRI